MNEQNIKNADYLGYEGQSSQLVEECAELIQAVSKYRRALKGSDGDLKDVTLSNLIEEIADVEVMLEQVKYLLHIPEEELEAMKTYKINRTRDRIQHGI